MRKKHFFPLLLLALILLLHLPVIVSPVNYLLTWFNTDDAFYYFVPARNVAAGLGFTFDGLARTNGFHPLWMVVLIPIFALPGEILPLRVLAGLLILLNMGTALLLFRLVRRHLAAGIAFLVALAFSLLPILHNETTKGGVEAGLNVFMVVLLLNRLAETDVRKPREVLITSGVTTLTFLARLDNVFLAGLGGVWLIASNWKTLSGGEHVWRARVRVGAQYFVPVGVVLVAYMAWNQIGFGTLTPVSGQVKRWWGTLPNTVYGFPPKRLSNFVGQFVTDDQSIGPWAILTGPFYRAAEGAVTLLGQDPTTAARRLSLAGLGIFTLGVLITLGWRNRAWVWQAVRDFGLIPLLGGCLVQIAYYKIGGSVAQRTWYWVTEMLWSVLLVGLVVEMAWRALPQKVHTSRLTQFGVQTLVIVLAIFLLIPHLDRIPRIFSAETRSGEAFYLRRANWLEANTEPGALIGMTGSGSSGYFTEGRTVTNLDGLINSVAYFEAMKAGTAGEYLEGLGLDYVFGSPYIVLESDPYGGIFAGRLEQAAQWVDGDRVLVLWRFLNP